MKARGDGTVSIARALSKLGLCSRAEGERLVSAGRVRVDGEIVRDIARRVNPERGRITVDTEPVSAAPKLYIALNKPRGLVTTRHDPEGRATIYECLAGVELPFVSPVGRLDKASEGLLLLTNDTQWGARLTDPSSSVEKVYHVQLRGVPTDDLLHRLTAGVEDPASGLTLSVVRAELLRVGSRSSFWLALTLDEGKNRQIRRLTGALGFDVLRLIRVSIGPLPLGQLAKGEWRQLTAAEIAALS